MGHRLSMAALLREGEEYHETLGGLRPSQSRIVLLVVLLFANVAAVLTSG